MHEILRNLSSEARVLDLGCHEGSFPSRATAAQVVRLDRDAVHDTLLGGDFVCSDATCLPFADQSFDAIIANHSLEHFENLERCLLEINRVLKPHAALFVSVPDASTITDKIYRWLARGGGHVNAFTSSVELAQKISNTTGLVHVATRVLGSSLSFLNRRNSPTPRPRRLLLLGGGYESVLFFYVWASRRIDHLLNLRSSVYGWAFYFGEISEPVATETLLNACIRCGSSSPVSRLLVLPNKLNFFRTYKCPECNAINPFIRSVGELQAK